MNRASQKRPKLQRAVARVHVEARRGAANTEVPVIVLDSGVSGPTAAVTANLHGDEATGIGVVQALDRWLQANPFRGKVVLYPSCNPQGLRSQTRVVPADEVDLNRVFPGHPTGSWAARIAAALWRDLEGRDLDVLVDLHADAPHAVPYVIVDRPVRRTGSDRRRLSASLLRLAAASGFTVLREYPADVYVQFALDRSLAGAVVNVLGVPAVTLEVGPRRQILPEAVDTALAAVLGVLGEAGIVTYEMVRHPSAVKGNWRRATTPRTRRGGLVEPLVSPGECFKAGDPLARIRSLVGDEVELVTAKEDGLLVSWVEGAWVSPGGLLGTLGVKDGARL